MAWERERASTGRDAVRHRAQVGSARRTSTDKMASKNAAPTNRSCLAEKEYRGWPIHERPTNGRAKGSSSEITETRNGP